MPTAKPGHRKYTGPWTLTIASYFILPGAFFVFLGLGLLVSIMTAGNKPVATGVVTGSIAWEGFIIGGALLTLVGFGLIPTPFVGTQRRRLNSSCRSREPLPNNHTSRHIQGLSQFATPANGHFINY